MESHPEAAAGTFAAAISKGVARESSATHATDAWMAQWAVLEDEVTQRTAFDVVTRGISKIDGAFVSGAARNSRLRRVC